MAIAKAAVEGDPERFHFPRPMVNRPGLDFSFSGLKTFVRTTAADLELDQKTIADICRAFEDAVVDTLAIKCLRALKQADRSCLVIAGGVGANQSLRSRLRQDIEATGGTVYYPRPEFCTDNGAMIAYAGAVRLRLQSSHLFQMEDGFEVKPRWSIEEIETPMV